MKLNLNMKYYYLINEDLKMSKGKIAAQTTHVAMQLGKRYGEIGSAIVLRAPESLMKQLMFNSDVYYIEDAGFTECPAGSLTCLGFKSNENYDKITNSLKLL